jgi:hypothetical protein
MTIFSAAELKGVTVIASQMNAAGPRKKVVW